MFCFRSPTRNNKIDDSYDIKPSKSRTKPTSVTLCSPTTTKRDRSISERTSHSSCSTDQSNNHSMEFLYITDRIAVVLFPTNGTDAQYRMGLKDVTSMLRKNHSDRYRIFNVSKKRSDLGRLHPVVELGWPQDLAPPLDRLCSICKMLESWLATNVANVAVIHCKGGRSRVAVVLAAYMHYINICNPEDTISERFAMQRFSERYLGIDGQPSNRRYVDYFASLLSGATKINSSTIYLSQIIIKNLSGRSVLFKIYERMQPIHTTSLISTNQQTVIDLDGLPLRGDVLVKCFERTICSERSTLFRCQFNTCTFDLSTSDANTFILRFRKEQLDDIFNDRSLNADVSIELVFLTEQPKNRKRRSITECSRADSYENFDRVEEADERNEPNARDALVVEYTEIQRPTDSTDSGIGSDSPNTCKVDAKEKETMPPVPPPKPRLSGDQTTEETDSRIASRSHSALPASVRPPTSPSHVTPTDGRSTPRFEPDLVGKDRYDPASKCFSYVPARALNAHFTSPRKPAPKVRTKEVIPLDVEPSASLLAEVPVTSTNLVRRPETPKWDDEIERIANEYKVKYPPNGQTIRSPEPQQLQPQQPIQQNGEIVRGEEKNSTTFKGTDRLENQETNDTSAIEERPIVIDQAKKATKKRKTRYGSYKTLNDDAFNSDMDDLCDPDFYLNYSTSRKPTTPVAVDHSAFSADSSIGTVPRTPQSTVTQPQLRSVAPSNIQRQIEYPKKRIEILSREPPMPNESLSFSVAKPSGSFKEFEKDPDIYRNRNCRSVAAVPLRRDSLDKETYNIRDRRNSMTETETAENWLDTQFRKLRIKRESEPDILRRKRQERMLLEELKHAHDDRMATRGVDERTYSTEGYGTKQVDPLSEYRMEEERLRSTTSPFIDHREREETYVPRRTSQSRSCDAVRHKPPTPPPRARSRSPPLSPFGGRRSVNRTPILKQSAYQLERANIMANEENGLMNDADNAVFRQLRNVVQEDNSRVQSPLRMQERPPSRQRMVNRVDSTDGRSSVAAWRGYTPTNEMRNQDWSSSAVNRTPTPSFPVKAETPLPYHPLLFNGATDNQSYSINYRSASPRSLYYGQSRRSSQSSMEPGEIITHHPVFVRDTSKYWYKPKITREEAINMLRDKEPGTFVVRDSNSFPGAFGLALKVATPPPGVTIGDGTELVRHFLIEPSSKGVKLKGCNNEPVFGTLSALVYQHSITALALPTKLLLPEYDPAITPEHVNAAQALLQQGAACNVTYIATLDTESLTGHTAVARCIGDALRLNEQRMIQPISVHFKVSAQGITITDNTRRLFFRRHYPVQSVSYAGLDPCDRRWDNSCMGGQSGGTYVKSARMFAFVARKIGSRTDNACHVFAELEPEQPATAVVNFITKVMLPQSRLAV